MDTTKLSLVHMTDEEISEAKTNGKHVVSLPDTLQNELANNFYGGYSSGTAPMGPVPNVIVLRE